MTTLFTPDDLAAYLARYPTEAGFAVQAAAKPRADGMLEVPNAALEALRRLPRHPIKHPAQRGALGLGDAVAAVAQPVARILDGALGTDLVNCGGCKSRRAALNRLVPNLRP